MVKGHDGLIAGKYRITDKIGEGAIGVVWRAHDESLRRDVAIKEIRFPAGMAAEQARSLEERTLREARAAAKLSSHPGIVVVHEVVYEDGRPWIVMELVRGRTLEQLVKENGPLPPRQVAAIGATILAGLRGAHAAGIVHRDVKPSNVMFDGERTVITDFGIAALDGGTVLTQTGAVLGTPSFMAPEQARGQFATPASDLWALGATMYHAVEGRPPFDAESVAAVLVAVLTAEPPPPMRAGPLAPVIAGLLVKDPARRTSAADLAGQLAHVAGGGEAPIVTAYRFPSVVSPIGPPGGTFTGGGAATTPPVGRSRTRLTALLGAAAAAAALVATLIWQPWDQAAHAGRKANTSGITPSSAAAGPTGHPSPIPANRRFPSTTLKTGANVFALAYSPDGTRLAGAGARVGANNNSAVQVWDPGRHVQLAQILGNKDGVEDVRFSRDGKLLATAGDDKTVRLWDFATHKSLAVLRDNTNEVWSVDLSPDNKTLVSGSKDGTIRIWDVASKKMIRVLHAHENGVTHVRFSPDGRTLASGSWDNSVRLWNPGTWDQRAVLDGHTNSVHGLVFSPDGRTLATSDEDGKILFWNVATHVETGVLTNTGQQITSLAYSPDGRTLASGDRQDHKVILWDLTTFSKIAEFKSHKGNVDGLAFSPDGRTLASGAEDKTIRLWDLTR